jgi:hypothetical protein
MMGSADHGQRCIGEPDLRVNALSDQDHRATRRRRKHVGEREVPYVFTDLDQLLWDFSADVAAWTAKRGTF